MNPTANKADPVAIIGMALRYAGASTIEQYWHNICNNVDALHTATDEEILEARIHPDRIDDPAYVRPAAFIPNAADFDASFFGFSAHDAAIVDPQHRVFLECAWEAFEDAGYNPLVSGTDVGVFAGCGANSYRKQNLDPNMGMGNMLETMVGNDKDFLATRVAYKLNLTGPAVVVQSACSTSLVATQMAFESLRRGECSMALAGGVSISFPQNTGYVFEPGMILSPDGRCRAFDAKAAGTAIGRGAGVVLLKPLSAARRDHDHIYAVIQGAAINNDGAGKAGYTAPSVEGQADVIRKSMSMAGFAPSTVRYVEAHGTGTEIGDSIEIAALAEAFGDTPLPPGSCTVSSVKPNIGHTDTAAGVSGLIKAAICLHHRVIPGTLYFETPNPELGLPHTPFKILSRHEFYVESERYRAGVSAFGIGGTNAHVSLEEWREDEALDASCIGTKGQRAALKSIPAMFPVSANSSNALASACTRLAEFLLDHPAVPLEDIAFTLQAGRKRYTHRTFFVSNDREDLVQLLRSGAVQKNQQAVISDHRTPDVYFLFPGQGAQYVNMTRGLYEVDPSYRATIDHGCEVLEPLLGFDLRSVLYPDPSGEDAASQRLQQTEITQPAVFLTEYALAKRLIDAGVRPTAMIGHSLGEYVAAVVAGVFEPDDILRLIAERGRLVQSVPGGSMLAVSLSEEALRGRLPDALCIAALNAPKQTIVSGPTDQVQAFYSSLLSERIACQLLKTSHAFHSSMLDPLVGTTAANLRKLRSSPISIPFLSNLTGTWITEQEARDPEYWDLHLRHTVRFSEGLQELVKKGSGVLIEVGPGETLLALARSATKGIHGIRHIATTRRPSVHVPDAAHWIQAMGQLWLAGVQVDWQSIHLHGTPRRVSLPTYPFERQRYWIDHHPKTKQGEEFSETALSRKRADIHSWLYTRSWTSALPGPATAVAPDNLRHWLIFKNANLHVEWPFAQQRPGLETSTIVVPGEAYERNSGEAFTINLEKSSHLLALLKALDAEKHWPSVIVYPVSGRKPALPEVKQVLQLCETLAALNQGRTLSLFMLVDRAFDVLGSGNCLPTNTSVASLIDAIGLEVPGLTVRVIDCDFTASTFLGKQIQTEVMLAEHAPLVAYRGHIRWIPSWKALPPAISTSSPLRSGETYIVTGGTGGIGMVLAQHLASTWGAHLVLVSRTALAPQHDWERMAGDPSTSVAIRNTLHSLMAIGLLGGSVEVHAADVADSKQMQSVFAAAVRRNGRVTGIIHAAGVTGSTVLGSTTEKNVEDLLSAKEAGTQWIEDVLRAHPDAVDFILLCSSLSAVLPSVGLSVYGAANAYLDGFAAAHDNPQGTRVIAANWDNWNEVGMAREAADTMQVHHLRDLSAMGITNREAVNVFERLLQVPASQVAISTRPLTAWISQVRALYSGSTENTQAFLSAPGAGHHPRPDLTQDYAQPTNETELAVVAIWQDLLGLDRVGIHDDFFELGGHSLLGTQVIARVREQFQVDFPLRLIFEATTPERFAALLLRLLRNEKPAHTSAVEQEQREEIEI